MKTTTTERKALVDKAGKLSLSKQCDLLSISRSSLYYQAASESDLNLELMQKIDQKYMQQPFMGVPTMTQWLRMDEGYMVNKKRVERLFRIMDISAIVPGPHTSKGNKEHKKYPYLLRNLKITHKNQVWAIDITYIPIKGGFMYLVAVIDLYSRWCP
jgi:putative transposase